MAKEVNVTTNEGTPRAGSNDVGVAALVSAMLGVMDRLGLDYEAALTVSLTTYMHVVEATGEAMRRRLFTKNPDDTEQVEREFRNQLRLVGTMLEGLSDQPLEDWSDYLAACREQSQGKTN